MLSWASQLAESASFDATAAQRSGSTNVAADYRMIGTNGRSARAIPLFARGWIATMEAMGFGQRIAEVGQPILTKVAVLSAAEAKAINEAYRQKAEVSLAAARNDISASWARRELDCAGSIDDLLAGIGEVSYFSPWVIVEQAAID
jgi:hypothetical protein